jgi:hypothetical protein
LVVALHLYKGGGLDPLPTDFRVNPVVLGNQSRDKLGTLTDSAHARTVRATTTDSPDRGPSARHIWCPTGTYPPTCDYITKNELGDDHVAAS